jgi:uncharacterized protein (DUF433 family)
VTVPVIASDPAIVGGKPCVLGTRLSVQFILELIASGADEVEIVESYPQLSIDSVRAAVAYAAQSLKNEVVWDAKITT